MKKWSHVTSFTTLALDIYNYLDSIESHFSAEAIKLVRGLVDLCYNESIASTLSGNRYNFSLDQESDDLIQCLERQGEPMDKEDVLLIPKKETKYFTWESLEDVFLEVDELQKDKGLGRRQALEEYKRKNSIKNPAIKLAKYITLGLAPSLLPGGDGIMEIVTTGLNTIAGDTMNEKLKRPSQKEIVEDMRTYKVKRKITEKAIQFTSVTK